MRVTKDVIRDTTRVTTTHTNRDKMKSTGFCTWSKQLSYIQTQSHKCWGHTNTITGTIRHNHKHETHTHDSSQSPAAAHTDTHRQPQSQKHRVTLLATSPSLASPPFPPGTTHKAAVTSTADTADRQGCTGSLGSRPLAQLESWSLGGQN